MKKNNFAIFLIISLFCPLAAFAKVQEPVKAFKLIESLNLSQTEEVIQADHPELTKKDKKLHIVGRQRSSSLDGKTKVLQVVWTGIQNEKNQHASFDKPLITVVQASQEDLPKDLELPFEGDLKQLDIAYEKLKSGQVGTTKEMTAANPESNSRRVNESAPTKGGLDANGNPLGGSESKSGLGKDGTLGGTGGQGDGIANAGDKGSDKKGTANPTTASRSNGSSAGGNRGGYGSGSSAGSIGSNPSGSIPAFQPASASNANARNADVAPQDRKTVEIEDCEPRIDEVQERVYLQNCTIQKTNGAETSRGQCEDTLRSFELKKDYNGEGCVDYVNHVEKKAYDRYRKYWVDGRGERHYVGETLYIEDDKPRPFIEEKGNCSAHLDLETMRAHPQVETVYYGRGNARVVVAACHKDLNLNPVPIEETTRGCEPLHNLEAKTSTERKRGVYQIGDSEYQAFACRNSGDPLPHEFDISSPCRGVKNMCTKTIMPMGKRFVTLRDGTKHKIGDECEPFGEELGLEFTTEGCDGYQHDIEAGKSYALGKWFYTYRNRPQIVSGCVAGSKVFVHQTEIKGYEHDDDHKASYEKQDIWFETEGDDVVVERRKIRYDLPSTPYQFKEDRITASQLREPYFDGCYQFTPQDKYKVFKRADNSEFLAFLNTSADKKSSNMCQVRQEQERYREYVVDFIEVAAGHYPNDRGPRAATYASKSLMTDDIDVTFSNVWNDFKMEEMSLTSAGDQEFQRACMTLYPSHFPWDSVIASGGGMHLMYLSMPLEDEKLEELRTAVEKYVATPFKKYVQLRGFVDSTYVYYKRGTKSRDTLVLPSGDLEEGEWTFAEDTTWVPYGTVTNNVLSRNSNRGSFPGHVRSVEQLRRIDSHRYSPYYVNVALPGISRVN